MCSVAGDSYDASVSVYLIRPLHLGMQDEAGIGLAPDASLSLALGKGKAASDSETTRPADGSVVEALRGAR